MWGWLREDPRRGLYTDGEWSGVQAIPRMISINHEDELVQERLPEFETLRRTDEAVRLQNFTGRYEFQTVSGAAEIEGDIQSDDVFSFRFLADEENREYTDIIINPREGTYYAPMEESSLIKSVDKKPILGYFKRKEDGVVHLDILIDHSVAEIFINGSSAMTLRIYPQLEGGRMSVKSKGIIKEAEIHIYEIRL